MYTYLLTIFILCATSVLASAAPEPISPKTTVFVFDLHHVLFHPDIIERAHILWHSPQKWNILRHLLNPLFLIDLSRIFYFHTTAYERGMQILEKQYPSLQAADQTIIELANAQK